MFLYTGIVQALSYIALDTEHLTAFQVWSRSTKNFGRAFALPHRRTIMLDDIANAAVRLISVTRGVTLAMIISKKDGSEAILGLGIYRKKDCQRLVVWLRQRGVDVEVQPSVLGKGY